MFKSVKQFLVFGKVKQFLLFEKVKQFVLWGVMVGNVYKRRDKASG